MPNIYGESTTSSGTSTASSVSSGSSSETLDTNITITAAQVICNNNYQFVTLAEKQALQNVIEIMGGSVKKTMFTSTYDKNEDGIVDLAETANVALSILWDNIEGRPSISVSDLNTLGTNSHTHSNKDVLDLLNINNNGYLTFNNKVPIDLSSFMLLSTYDLDNDGIIDKSNYALSSDWTGILNKPISYTPSAHTHTISEISGIINANTLNGLTSEDFLKKTDTITLNQISDIDDLNISILKINGGNSGSTFEHVLNNETQIQIRSDTKQYWNINNPILKNAEQVYESDTKRIKIGNGINTYNSIPYSYNIPESIRFEMASNKFINSYYDNINKPEVTAELISTDILESGYTELYRDTIKASDNSYIGIPYMAKNVLYVDSNFENILTFGSTELEDLNSEGAGWISGVAYKNYIYCAPYNAIKILLINIEDKSVDSIDYTGTDIYGVKKYSKGIYCPINNRIYFAPYSSKSILEINPEDNSINFIGDSSIFTNDQNYCDIVFNPVDEKLYLIPCYGNKILQFNPITKQLKEVVTLRDNNIIKFSSAILASNGLIYCIPSYGYDYLAVFDPNIFDIDYYDFETDAYDVFYPVVSPDNKIYCIPSGATNEYIIRYNIETNEKENFYTITSSQDKWVGGVLSESGLITSLPSTTNKILRIDTKLSNPIDSNVLKYFSK